MLDKETYKRELVRMWDSLRDDKHKGYDDCNGVECEECPLNELKGCKNLLINYFELNEIVEKWSESHQNIKTVTNRDKLKEVFHIILDKDSEFYLSYYRLSLDDLLDGLEPQLIHVPMNDWLNAEYKEKEK